MKIVCVEDGIHRKAEAAIRKSGRKRFDSVEWRFVQVISNGICYRLKRLFGIASGKPYAVAIVSRNVKRIKWDPYIRELKVLDAEDAGTPELSPDELFAVA